MQDDGKPELGSLT